MDVVEVVHPSLPSYFGASSDAALPTYEGADVEISERQHFKRAKRYRTQIEGKEIDWSFTGHPRIRLTARLLTNYPIDPT